MQLLQQSSDTTASRQFKSEEKRARGGLSSQEIIQQKSTNGRSILENAQAESGAATTQQSLDRRHRDVKTAITWSVKSLKASALCSAAFPPGALQYFSVRPCSISVSGPAVFQGQALQYFRVNPCSIPTFRTAALRPSGQHWQREYSLTSAGNE